LNDVEFVAFENIHNEDVDGGQVEKRPWRHRFLGHDVPLSKPLQVGPIFFVDVWTLARKVEWLTDRFRKELIDPCVVIENSPTVRKRNSNVSCSFSSEKSYSPPF